MPIPNTTGTDGWRTPPVILDHVVARYGRIDLDLAAADQRVAVCPSYVGPGRAPGPWTDGLTWNPWAWTAPRRSHIWCNPPYSREGGGLEAWCQRFHEASLAGYRVTALFFARTETRAWHLYVREAYEVSFLRRRVKFLHPTTGQPVGTAPAPSVLVHWSGSNAAPMFRFLDLKEA